MMKKTTFLTRAAMTLLLVLFFPLWGSVGQLWADQVTASQARQQAQAFLNSRIASGNGPRHAPGVTPQLMQEKQVSGLYVFNINNNGGFIIVSNDDCALPILGYSDSGTLDPDNMPDNMRAWLQGYADEIAWAKEHGIVSVDSPATHHAAHVNKAPKAAIAPLLTTTWDQGAPYYNQTPYYYQNDNGIISYSKDALTNYEHCATGCVATAMAQVMKYHNWPEKPTKEIPAYSWHGYNLPALSASVTFDWTNMKNSYTGTETDATATAVATLMKYCGYSVKMNYGPESSSNNNQVAYALKEYFDYNENTVSCVDRSCYSYASWINLIYHELANDRPIAYSGQSSGGGHEFVVDGYQSEDFFHINWGWGGTSNSYFKLSSLNPYTQGIGGSSSNDGFHYWQDAVIGIQKSTENGTVLVVPSNTINLKLNSITLSQTTIAQGESVDVTVNVTNNSSDEYDGDIIIYAENIGQLGGKNFLIAAGETKACVVTISPDQGTYTLFPISGDGGYIQPAQSATQTSATLTVTTGSGNPTTNNITLGRTLIVENTELIEGKSYYIYGKTFKGTLTVTNPSTTHDYQGTYQYDLYQDYDWYNPVVRKAQWISVPANSSINIPIEYNGMEYGKVYELDVVYMKNNSSSGFDEVGYYTARPAVITYSADGTGTVSETTSTTFAAGSGVLAVDLTDSNIETVTSSEPNCLFIIGNSDTPPSGSSNIIIYDGNTYNANVISLQDGYGFFSPVDFTANNIVFNYNFTVGADGTNGWNTIMLPFDVTSVTADGTEIYWFHSASDTGKNFWVKQFAGDGETSVSFDFVDENTLQAYTPYIVAFPGNKWGDAWDMSKKAIKFIGENAVVHKNGSISSVTGDYYRFMGNTVQDNTENIYCLNTQGNTFILNENGGSTPFRAYFKPGIFDRSVTSLSIDNGTTTAISSMSNEPTSNNYYYDLQGRRVIQPQKGLYIVNGKKINVK